MPIYLDNVATTKLDSRVLDEMFPFFKNEYGNASSIYSWRRTAKMAIEKFRVCVSNIINCQSSEIYFISGGGESNNAIIKGIARANRKKGNHIITSVIEHLSILESIKDLEQDGFEVDYISVLEDGIIDLDELKEKLRPTTILISIMFANNEIGTIEEIKEIGVIAHEHKIIFHTDAVQAMGNILIDVNDLNIDALTLSAHKFYGPKGIGAMYIKLGISFNKYIVRGHQERDYRSGTENVAGIVGLGKAIELAYQEFDNNNDVIKKLRDYFLKKIQGEIKDIKINGSIEERLPGNCNITFSGISGETLLINLDLAGICCSSGSACTSGSLDSSHILKAIGLSDSDARSSIRISIGKNNNKEEIDHLTEKLVEIVDRFCARYLMQLEERCNG